MTAAAGAPLQPGARAPDLTLPAVDREGVVRLHEYRRPLLLGLFRGLHCPFCRRQVFQFGAMRKALQEAGAESLAVVNTTLERARLYFRYHPTAVPLAADPDAVSHRAFGVPAVDVGAGAQARWPASLPLEQFATARINPTGELPEPVSPFEANEALNQRDRFEMTAVDRQIVSAHGTQLAAYFLLDAQAVIRWTFLEADRSPQAIGTFPTPEALLAAVRDLGPTRAG
jgi:peroxiredoxin